MNLFAPLYARVMSWARHPHAAWYLGGLSFAESSFFPVPPDVMLAPMSLGKPGKAMRYALITTLASVAGGIMGYLIGMFFFDLVQELLASSGNMDKYQLVNDWFAEWGFWAIFIAGFSPIPYKLFTISAGVLTMAFLPFLIASAIGRGARFFLVAGLMAWGGEKMEQRIKQYVEWIGWGVLLLLLLVIVIYKMS